MVAYSRSNMSQVITARSLRESELPAADTIMRLAFGTFIGLPDPMSFLGSANFVRSRWLLDPETAFAAEVNGELAGSNFATMWGSIGFFGPLTVHPKFWDAGVGKRLIEPVIELFEKRGTTHQGLFTFAQSSKHLAVYQKFGFWPRFLTAIMSKPAVKPAQAPDFARFSKLSESEQESAIEACRDLTGSIYPGLDVACEIRTIARHQLGETILLWDKSKLIGVAVCHTGAGTEAGADVYYVKFAAIRPSNAAAQHFERLLDACESAAADEKVARILAGVNTARHEAYRQMLRRGFRTDIQGVVMERLNKEGYNRPGVWILDDWR